MRLPKEPFAHIAVSLSGGGYRAAAFHLGMLTFLSSIKFKNNSLLENTKILSTVSGGTFVGAKYASSKSIEKTYAELKQFITRVDLMEASVLLLASKKLWNSPKNKSLINAASLVYFDQFESGTFADLCSDTDFHLQEIVFNATEFSYGLPFRFQKTALEADQSAYLGNRQVNFGKLQLNEIRLADVIAASSCFPLGFEPINFPDDFCHQESRHLQNLTQSKGKDMWGNQCQFPIGLMDGGIVDNQGVESVLWAEKRMASYPPNLKHHAADDEKAIDLFIISDVSSPYMTGFVKSETKRIPVIGNWNFNTIRLVSVFSLLLAIVAFAAIFFASSKLAIASATVAGTLLLLFAGITGFLSGGFVALSKRAGVPDFFIRKIKKINRLSFNVLFNMVSNRLKSAKSMVSEVFMKQIRRYSYDKVYTDSDWSSRVVTNSIYELTPESVKRRLYSDKRSALSDSVLKPDEKILEVASKAYSMETTLWFTPAQLSDQFAFKHNMPDVLIACGQLTICFNLIEYIEKVLWGNDGGADNIHRPDIEKLHTTLLNHWTQFNENPFFMVDEWNNKYALKEEE